MTLAEQIKQVMEYPQNRAMAEVIRQLTDIVRVQHEALFEARPYVPDHHGPVTYKIAQATALSTPIVKEIV